ncbi:haloacid dehalogenase-like hydrolase [Enterobacteriaceae bacterium 4M9]|nr:haloacid dehalogenase-like hydrolase [Enterobacteriaceae bacterium 4M9]
MKRYLDCSASELRNINKADLIYAIRASEGRILVSESIGATQPLLNGITNAELAASQGADILLLNLFDVDNPHIAGLPEGVKPEETLRELQRLTGRVIGVNLEAVDPAFKSDHQEFWSMTAGRAATASNARRLYEMGARMVVLTGNPNNGVSNAALAAALAEIRDEVGDKMVLATGKMHGAGIVRESGSQLISEDDIARFVDNGADIVLIPAPGTIPGMTQQKVARLIDATQQRGALAMTAIGTSQEGADRETIRQIALMSKMAGADLHHIGDTGYLGLALPENIFAYSVVIRGVRHTYSRIARSVNR